MTRAQFICMHCVLSAVFSFLFYAHNRAIGEANANKQVVTTLRPDPSDSYSTLDPRYLRPQFVEIESQTITPTGEMVWKTRGVTRFSCLIISLIEGFAIPFLLYMIGFMVQAILVHARNSHHHVLMLRHD